MNYNRVNTKEQLGEERGTSKLIIHTRKKQMNFDHYLEADKKLISISSGLKNNVGRKTTKRIKI